jgi:hypothetical protein
MIRSTEAGSLPGYGGSSPFGHLLRFRTAQVLRRRLRFLMLLGWRVQSRLSPSLGANRLASSLFTVCRLRSNRTLLWRLWQIHGRGSLNSSSGCGGYMKSYAPEGSS